MKIVVIAAEASHAIHAGGGGEVERVARSFDAPPELASFIAEFRRNNTYASVSLAIDYEDTRHGQ